MTKLIVIDYEKCVGCGTCEQACSTKQTGIVNPLLSRIGVVKTKLGIEETIPIVCQQCQSAPCRVICPVKAISRDEMLGRMIIDYDVCIGCRMCVATCPFGCINFDPVEKKVFKCQLCDGDPICVRFCQHDALKYVEASEQGIMKRANEAGKLSGIMNKIATALAAAK